MNNSHDEKESSVMGRLRSLSAHRGRRIVELESDNQILRSQLADYNRWCADGTPFQTNDYTRGMTDAHASAMAAVTRILDGKDDGGGSNMEPWGTVRRRLLALYRQYLEE